MDGLLARVYLSRYRPERLGRVVMLGLQNEREWKAFCDVVLRDPALATDPRFDANVRRSEHRAELKAVIEQAFSSLTAQDVIARLDAAQIAPSTPATTSG